MELNSALVVYFSPTGTTRKILNAVTEGMGIEKTKVLDLTGPGARSTSGYTVEEDIVIIGIPVYEERIPPFLYPSLEGIRGSGKSVVLAAVYGNIGEGIVLKELKEISGQAGMKVVVAASFIGEHSFSYHELPIALGRPDKVEQGRSLFYIYKDKIKQNWRKPWEKRLKENFW